MKFRNMPLRFVTGVVVFLFVSILAMIAVYVVALWVIALANVSTQRLTVPSAPPTTTGSVRNTPGITYLVPRHNNYPAPVVVHLPEDTRFAVTGIGEHIELRLIRKSNQAIVAYQVFDFAKPVEQKAIFCLYGVEVNTGRCATIPEKDWQEGDYVFDVVASYSDGTRNSNQRQLHFDRWSGR